MAHASWGPGWPNCQTDRLVTVTTNGLRLPVREEIAALVTRLVADLARARGKPFRRDWSWGFACRAISGTRIPSNHSWGLSFDLDAPENPYMSAADHAAAHPLRKRFDNGKLLRSTMPKNAGAIAAKYGFRWGGDYSSKPDPMHFEFMGSVEDAARLTKKTRPKKRWRIVAKKVKRPVVTGWKNVKALIRTLKDRGFEIVRRNRIR